MTGRGMSSDPQPRLRIGIDLGGTKTEGAVLGDGAVLARERHATPRGDYDATLRLIRDIVRSLESRLGEPASVGIGIPGTLCPSNHVVKNANSTWLNGRPLDADLRALLGREVRLANDANCFALSEAVDGAGAGADPVFGVILGTGVGGGVVVGGRVLRGAQGIAGEWGHNPLPGASDEERRARPCYCGRYGCIETFLSGPALSSEFAASSGRVLEPTEIAAQAETGDRAAAEMISVYSERLARALASVVNIVDPEVVVLGGGLSRIDALYRLVPEKLGAHVCSPTITTRILPPVHGDSSGVRGAAWLWPAGASSAAAAARGAQSAQSAQSAHGARQE